MKKITYTLVTLVLFLLPALHCAEQQPSPLQTLFQQYQLDLQKPQTKIFYSWLTNVVSKKIPQPIHHQGCKKVGDCTCLCQLYSVLESLEKENFWTGQRSDQFFNALVAMLGGQPQNQILENKSAKTLYAQIQPLLAKIFNTQKYPNMNGLELCYAAVEPFFYALYQLRDQSSQESASQQLSPASQFYCLKKFKPIQTDAKLSFLLDPIISIARSYNWQTDKTVEIMLMTTSLFKEILLYKYSAKTSEEDEQTFSLYQGKPSDKASEIETRLQKYEQCIQHEDIKNQLMPHFETIRQASLLILLPSQHQYIEKTLYALVKEHSQFDIFNFGPADDNELLIAIILSYYCQQSLSHNAGAPEKQIETAIDQICKILKLKDGKAKKHAAKLLAKLKGIPLQSNDQKSPQPSFMQQLDFLGWFAYLYSQKTPTEQAHPEQ
ncbi:MAG: hypothetical protein H6679_05945 [Epsilonproteobacteria bacterium]|nr:hypothetical protein [Campylobacterota bacterium]